MQQTDKTTLKFLQDLETAEKVLIGIGEEFDDLKILRQNTNYKEGKKLLEKSELAWMVPAWNVMFHKICVEQDKNKSFTGLCQLAKLLLDKDYFVVSTSVNDEIRKIPWREGRLVMPCGGSVLKQCSNGCNGQLTPVVEADRIAIEEYMNRVICKKEYKDVQIENFVNQAPDIGRCQECRSPLILNNIYTEKYDEDGYLSQWGEYTKWLQGTLNKKLLILELGVGMQCPGVIRWPFEKIAFYNQKAGFYRVNENLYQLTEELQEKGTAIPQNAIEWLTEI